MIDPETPPGTLVRYQHEGTRYGYVDEIKKSTVWVRPIPPYKGAQPRSRKVDIADVFEEKC